MVKRFMETTDLSTVYKYWIGLVVCLVCFVSSFAGKGLHYTDAYREAILSLSGVLLFVFWLHRNRHSKALVFRVSALRVCLCALFLFASVSVFWAVNITFFLNKYLLWLAGAGIIFAVLQLQINSKTLIFLGRVLVASGAYIAFIGLLQALFGFDLFPQGKPPAANFLNKNAAAQCVVLLIPFGVFLTFVDRERPWAFLSPFFLVFMLAYIFHTHTRSAWLSVAVEFAVLLVCAVVFRKSIRDGLAKGLLVLPKKFVAVIAVVLLLVLVNVSADGWVPFTSKMQENAENIYTRATTQGGAGRGSNRFHIWKAAITMLKTSPIVGTGMGSFYHNNNFNAHSYQSHGELRAHNDLLELGVELGGIGLSLFFAAVVCLLLVLYRLIRLGDIRHRVFYVLLLMSLAGTAVNMQFSFPYQMPVPLMLLTLYLGLVVKGGDDFVATRQFSVPMRGWRWNLALGCSGVVFVAVLGLHFMWLNVFAQGHVMLKKSRWENPLSSPLMCHKTFVKSLHDLAVSHTRTGRYRVSNHILKSFDYCFPEVWLVGNIRGINLIGLFRFVEAKEVLEAAKNKAPIGAYLDDINLFLTYSRLKDWDNARRIYDDFRAEPEKLLAIQMISYRRLAQAALNLGEIEQALELYELHNKYHAKHPDLERQMKPHLASKNVVD